MIAPMELHGGWLVGKERILTVVSGELGWRDEKPVARSVNLNVGRICGLAGLCALERETE